MKNMKSFAIALMALMMCSSASIALAESTDMQTGSKMMNAQPKMSRHERKMMMKQNKMMMKGDMQGNKNSMNHMNSDSMNNGMNNGNSSNR